MIKIGREKDKRELGKEEQQAEVDKGTGKVVKVLGWVRKLESKRDEGENVGHQE